HIRVALEEARRASALETLLAIASCRRGGRRVRGAGGGTGDLMRRWVSGGKRARSRIPFQTGGGKPHAPGCSRHRRRANHWRKNESAPANVASSECLKADAAWHAF